MIEVSEGFLARRTFEFDVAPIDQTLEAIDMTAVRQGLVDVRAQTDCALAIVVFHCG